MMICLPEQRIKKIKSLLPKLIDLERGREKYLEKHYNVAKVMDTWLNFPYKALTEQINCCLEKLTPGKKYAVDDIIALEMHFDDCLIKLYNILSSEYALNDQMVNIFYYMSKKTRQEKAILTEMLHHPETDFQTTQAI
jgi:hypothetical protein